MPRDKTCSCQGGVDYVSIAVIFMCHDGQGNFVLAQRGAKARNETGTWDIGGGALELGEDAEQTLRREIKEEYCTEVLELEFLGYRDVHYDHEGPPTKHWLALDFCVHVEPTQVAIGEPHKLSDIGWFTFDSLPEPLYSRLPSFFQLHEEKIFRIINSR
ncbi:MAG: NUDIX domain-containing protein [Patescibacteria group bacterium]